MSRKKHKPYVIVGKETAALVECVHTGATLPLTGGHDCFVKHEDRVHEECWTVFLAHTQNGMEIVNG